MQEEDIRDILLKKAKGYEVEEVVEEYSDVDGELVLVKKKVTHKHIPPDAVLLKLLLENSQQEDEEDLSKYSESELRQMLKNLVEEESEA